MVFYGKSLFEVGRQLLEGFSRRHVLDLCAASAALAEGEAHYAPVVGAHFVVAGGSAAGSSGGEGDLVKVTAGKANEVVLQGAGLLGERQGSYIRSL